jgi:alpha-glucosidase (family GH31 glycosyl hydrolase)
VWPVDSVFVDFYADNALLIWKQWLTDFFREFNFDGVWLDMNEVENFCDGWCYIDQQPDYRNDLEWTESQLPYTPGQRSLNSRSLMTTAKHENGVREIDTHSLYGSMEVKATKEWYDD